MYIARVPNRKSPPAILLRESVRVADKVSTRTLANITHWAAERIDALDRCLKGEFDRVPPSDASGTISSGPSFGALHVLARIAERLGISKALGSSRQGKLALFMVLARIAAQGSRLSAVRWSEGQAVREILGLAPFDEDDLYAALDWTCDQQEQIEGRLFDNYCAQHQAPPSLVLYDVTSSYFEGDKNEMAMYGYNRDGKRGKKQIVIGLLTGPDGVPLAVRVFPGNTADPTTVSEQVRILADRYHIEELVFVGDRGMVKQSGQQTLTEAGYRFITALTDPQIRALLNRGLLQMDLFDEQVQEADVDGVRVVVRCNPTTARREAHRRAHKIEKLRQRVSHANQRLKDHPRAKVETAKAQLDQWARRHKLQSFISIDQESRSLALTIDNGAQEQAGLLDGCYAIITDAPAAALTTDQVHDRYLDLTQIERNFRTMKTGLLELRPIYVRKERRTRAHVFLTMLALHATRHIQDLLAAAYGTTDDDRYALTVEDALNELGKNCFVSVKTKKVEYHYLLALNKAQRDIAQSLHLEPWGNRRESVKAVVARAKRRGRTPK